MIEDTLVIPLADQKALLLSDTDWGLEELEGLLTTMGGKAMEKLKIPLRKIDPGTYIGKGKLDELRGILESQNLDMLLVDFDLSPSQLRNIEKGVKKLVLDRSGIILEIFNRHARTKEAKMQVELARLEYLAPRLMGLWSHFERQRGSGGGALKGKGMGEKQIEVDRRLVKDRMSQIRKKLKIVEEERKLHRRHRDSLLKVAIVGYTNAGKSTLLNALTHSDVLVEDALFATLDATVRLINPKSRPAILGIDTVGFIDRLPHGLVASFRSTLGEVLEADLLVHVLDASNPEVERQFTVTMKVLEELGAIGPNKDIPMMLVFNKMDLIQKNPSQLSMVKVWGGGLSRTHGLDAPIYTSALDAKSVDEARTRILKHFEKSMQLYEIVIPFEDGKSLAQVHELGNVETKRNTEKGVFVRLRTIPAFADKLNLKRFRV